MSDEKKEAKTRSWSRKKKEIIVPIEENDGTVRKWKLKELSGRQRNEWFGLTAKRMKKKPIQHPVMMPQMASNGPAPGAQMVLPERPMSAGAPQFPPSHPLYAAQMMHAQAAGMSVPGASEEGEQDFTDLMADLLSLTLYDPDDRRITLEEANELPAAMQQDLFNMSLELSGLNKEGQAAAKNA